MKRIAATLVAAGALTGCSGSDTMTRSEAFCSSLRAGSNPIQLYDAVRNSKTPAEFASDAFGYAATECPEQLQSNVGLRTFLEAWGINPDA
jgi:hypothetical protein